MKWVACGCVGMGCRSELGRAGLGWSSDSVEWVGVSFVQEGKVGRLDLNGDDRVTDEEARAQRRRCVGANTGDCTRSRKEFNRQVGAGAFP